MRAQKSAVDHAELERQRHRNCTHDVNELLQKERQWMPLFNKRDGMVWCDQCGVWIAFEWTGSPDSAPAAQK